MGDDLREKGRWLAHNVLPHEKLLRARLSEICRYDLDIEDVIQETYARFMAHPSLETIRHPRQYALLIARGIIIDNLRRAKVISISTTDNLDLIEVPTTEVDAERRLEFNQEIQTVIAALQQLPAPCRETLILRRVEGLSQREVAERLGVSEKTVEKYMANAVRQLIKVFGRGGKMRTRSSNSESLMRFDDVAKESRD